MAQHGVEVGAHLLHAQLQQLSQLPGHAERLVLKGALQHVLLAGQLEAHAPQAPHALAQERLHLGPGVPVVRALGADHPVPLGVEEVGLVRELQDGAARVQRGLHLLPDPLRHLLLREVRRVPRGPAQLIHRQPVPALVVPPAAPPAPDDHRHVDQVLVVLVAEEALAQLGQPVLSALQGARKLLPPVAEEDVVVGPLTDEGLVVVEVLAGGPQAQVGVVALARPGQLPVRAREQRVGFRAAPQVQHDGTIRPRASPGAAVRGLRDLLSLSRPTCHSFFTGHSFFLVGAAKSGVRSNGLSGRQSVFAAGGLVPVGFKHSWLSTKSLFARESSATVCDGDSIRVRARGARGGSEPGAVYRPSALRENGDSRAQDPGRHAGDTVLPQHRLQAGSAHL